MKLYIQTPMLESRELNQLMQAQVYFKIESVQPSGSFKNRGIGHMCQTLAKQGASSFVSSSGGNAGLAVAYSGRMLNLPVTVVVPETTPLFMRHKIAAEGAQVQVHGSTWDEADQLARKIAAEGASYISPFDHPLIWAGHATLIEEISQSGIVPDVILLAVGGGGLFCGIVEGLRAVGWHHVPIMTAETAGAASFAKSLAAGRIITLDSIQTVARSLGAKTIAATAFQYAQEHPTLPCIVSDKQALAACRRFAGQERILVEPACGAALALLYEGLVPDSFKNIAVIVCGGCGVSLELLQQWQSQLK